MLLIFSMVLLYLFLGKAKQYYEISFGHQACVVAAVGVGISYVMKIKEGQTMQDLVEFNDNLFFYFCLPPLVFASGFNMQRKKFFENITNIVLFGVVGTITSFVIFASLVIWLTKQSNAENGIFLWQTNGVTGETIAVNLTLVDILSMCALLCSTDVIAAISMVSYNKYPKLFSLLFGESVVNDAVAIILFNTMQKLNDIEIGKSTIPTMIGEFLLLSILSLMIGFCYGALASLILKKFRVITRDAISECILLFSIGYICYVTAEWLKQSGIIALLTCGAMMANYAWYNLSPQGRQGTALVFEFLGNGMQGFIFAYLGLTFFAYKDYDWSPSLAMYMLPIVIIGRFGSTLGLIKVLEWCCCYNSGVRWQEVFFIGFAGIMRGAIAFGLTTRLPHTMANRGVVITTALSLVLGTIIFFGLWVGLVGNWAMDTKQEVGKKEYERLPVDEDDHFQKAKHIELAL